MTDTIFALATAPGRGALAVIRVSGPSAGEALQALTRRPPPPRLAALRTLRAPDGEDLDRAIVLWFPAPASYTGEDCAELHLHGGPAVVEGVSAALLEARVRLAEPGEFTRRAFENGKLDLSQAEAIADLIDSETAAQARQAVAQLEGALGVRYRRWRKVLIGALAQLEAAIDFPDEALPQDLPASARGALVKLLAEIDLALDDRARGRRVRDGYRVAVIGAPNAGKSSLLNALAGRSAAIVASTPGTTRDVIEVPLTIAGFRVIVADMAGMRRAAEAIEREGVRRARDWARSADLRLWVVDGAGGVGAWREAAPLVKPGDLCLLNKADLPPGEDAPQTRQAAVGVGAEVIDISLRSGDAEALLAILAARASVDLAGSDFPAVTRARHETHLREARANLARGIADCDEPELAAESVRIAVRSLSRITGEVGAEDVLDLVFASFCIGK